MSETIELAAAQPTRRVSRAELRTMEATLLAEVLQELRQQNAQTTRQLAQLRSGIVNDVLSSGVVLLDAAGLYTESFQTPYGSIAIANHGLAGTMTLVSASPAGAAPTRGKGMAVVPPGVFAVVNLADTQYTIYGAAGDRATVQVFTRPQPPVYAPCV